MIHKDVRVGKIFLGAGVLIFVIMISLAVAWYINRPTVMEPLPFPEQRLVVGCTNNFPPFDLLDKNGNHIGYAREISTEVARELGCAIEYRTSPHWVEVVEWLKNGDVDLIHLIAYSRERDEYFDFTIPHTLVPEVIFVRSERLDIRGLDDLADKQIGAVRRHITHEKLLKYEEVKENGKYEKNVILDWCGASDTSFSPWWFLWV
jgi:ABC-type amino acid transport substrate-binding protein